MIVGATASVVLSYLSDVQLAGRMPRELDGVGVDVDRSVAIG